MLSMLGRNLNWISVTLNIFLLIMMGTVGFMAHDIYTEIRAYPNSAIKEDIHTLQKRVDDKVGIEKHSLLCDEVKKKANKETVTRIDKNIQKRLDMLVTEVRALREDLHQYFYQKQKSRYHQDFSFSELVGGTEYGDRSDTIASFD